MPNQRKHIFYWDTIEQFPRRPREARWGVFYSDGHRMVEPAENEEAATARADELNEGPAEERERVLAAIGYKPTRRTVTPPPPRPT